MKIKSKQKPLLFLAVLMFMIALPFGSADAMYFELGEELTLDCDVQLIYAAGVRVKDPYAGNLTVANQNADDGTRNFDQWDLINSRFSTIIDMDLRYKNFGYFFRPKAFYDFVYMTDNAHDNPASNNALVAGLIQENDEWSSEVKKVHGRNVEVLDYFGYASFEIGDFFVDLRAGNQVIQWGESLYYSGIAGAMAHNDIATAFTPGSEVKEFLLPSQGASLGVDLTETISISAYYQWEWDHHKYFEAGSFFNALFDIIDEGGRALIIVPGFSFLSRVDDIEPEDEDQYGVRLIYRAGEALNFTEFAFHYIRFHPKLATDVGLTFTGFLPSPPFPPFTPASGTYQVLYWEDVDVYAVSFGSQIGDVNVNGEIGYYQDFPIAVEMGGFTGGYTTLALNPGGYQKEDYVQAQVSAIYYAAPPIFKEVIDTISYVTEIVTQYVVDLDTDELAGDKFAWAATFSVTPSFREIITGVDMSIPVTFNWDPNGDGYGAAGLSIGEGGHTISVGLNFTIFEDYRFNIRYADYLYEDEVKAGSSYDRTNINCKLTYSF